MTTRLIGQTLEAIRNHTGTAINLEPKYLQKDGKECRKQAGNLTRSTDI
jgi:hypothetical protein